jgi:hypothetical protein
MNIIKYITIRLAGIFSGIRTLSPRARMYVFLGIVGLGFASILFLIHLSSSRFARDYEVYAFLAKTHQDKAYIPGAPNNPVRIELNQVLSDVLGTPMSTKDRLASSKKGLLLVEELDKQIEDISKAGDAADIAIAKMQIDMLDAFSISQRARELVALAKKRAAIISDIRAYSYRADFEVEKIFNHIIADGGRLRDAYILELNAAIPALEVQFDSRQNLYNDLQAIDREIEQKAEDL